MPDEDNPEEYDITTLVPWKIRFDSDKDYSGKATMTIMLCGNRGGSLKVKVNDNIVYWADSFPLTDGTVLRAAKHSLEQWITIEFDASLLKEGENIVELSHINSGSSDKVFVIDCIRMEVDESTSFEPVYDTVNEIYSDDFEAKLSK